MMVTAVKMPLTRGGAESSFLRAGIETLVQIESGREADEESSILRAGIEPLQEEWG
jgi:hypothetical protein